MDADLEGQRGRRLGLGEGSAGVVGGVGKAADQIGAGFLDGAAHHGRVQPRHIGGGDRVEQLAGDEGGTVGVGLGHAAYRLGGALPPLLLGQERLLPQHVGEGSPCRVVEAVVVSGRRDRWRRHLSGDRAGHRSRGEAGIGADAVRGVEGERELAAGGGGEMHRPVLPGGIKRERRQPAGQPRGGGAQGAVDGVERIGILRGGGGGGCRGPDRAGGGVHVESPKPDLAVPSPVSPGAGKVELARVRSRLGLAAGVARPKP